MEKVHCSTVLKKRIIRSRDIVKNPSGWISYTPLVFNPCTLEENCLLSLIDNAKSTLDFKDLNIPDCLKRALIDRYLIRRLEYKGKFQPVELTMDFDTMFTRVSVDERLTIRYSTEEPPFGYHRTVIYFNYFYFPGDDKRYCAYCWNKHCPDNYKGVELWQESDICGTWTLMDEIWSNRAWCYDCKITALFRLEDFDDDATLPIVDYRRPRCLRTFV